MSGSNGGTVKPSSSSRSDSSTARPPATDRMPTAPPFIRLPLARAMATSMAVALSRARTTRAGGTPRR